MPPLLEDRIIEQSVATNTHFIGKTLNPRLRGQTPLPPPPPAPDNKAVHHQASIQHVDEPARLNAFIAILLTDN